VQQLDEFRSLIVFQRLAQFLEKFWIGSAGAICRIDQIGDFFDQRVFLVGCGLRLIASNQLAAGCKIRGPPARGQTFLPA